MLESLSGVSAVKLKQTILVAIAFGVTSTQAFTDDYSYISLEELKTEIDRRRSDVERTRSRMASLEEEKILANSELVEAEKRALEADEMVAVRAKAFYRLSRKGKAIRYLLGAQSPVQMLKRYNQLKRLMQDGIKDRQQASLRLQEAKSNVERIEREKYQAGEVLSMLEQALAELQTEYQNREI